MLLLSCPSCCWKYRIPSLQSHSPRNLQVRKGSVVQRFRGQKGLFNLLPSEQASSPSEEPLYLLNNFWLGSSFDSQKKTGPNSWSTGCASTSQLLWIPYSWNVFSARKQLKVWKQQNLLKPQNVGLVMVGDSKRYREHWEAAWFLEIQSQRQCSEMQMSCPVIVVERERSLCSLKNTIWSYAWDGHWCILYRGSHILAGILLFLKLWSF